VLWTRQGRQPSTGRAIHPYLAFRSPRAVRCPIRLPDRVGGSRSSFSPETARMTVEIALVFGILLGTIVLFVTEWIRMDLVPPCWSWWRWR
jgi:hypothetical protein